MFEVSSEGVQDGGVHAKQSQSAAGRLEAAGRRGLHRRPRKTKPMETGVTSLKFQVSSRSGGRPVVRLQTLHFRLATRSLLPRKTKPISGRVSSGKCEVSSKGARHETICAKQTQFRRGPPVTNKANLSGADRWARPTVREGGERGRSPYCAKQSQMWEGWDIWGMSASWAGRPCHRGGCAKQSQFSGLP
jgi:hypothetical protein